MGRSFAAGIQRIIPMATSSSSPPTTSHAHRLRRSRALPGLRPEHSFRPPASAAASFRTGAASWMKKGRIVVAIDFNMDVGDPGNGPITALPGEIVLACMRNGVNYVIYA